MKTEHARLCGTAKSRAHLVEQCRALATYLGCNFTSNPMPLAPRALCVGFNFGPYCMSARFDGDSRVGSFLGHWYIQDSKTATFPASFSSVNPFHRQKATTCADGFEDFLDCIRRGFTDLKQREAVSC